MNGILAITWSDSAGGSAPFDPKAGAVEGFVGLLES